MQTNQISWLEQQRDAERMQVRKLAYFARAAHDANLKHALEENCARHLARCKMLDAQMR